jgi:hypothetical protein
MKYRIFGPGWPVGQHLVPTGTVVDTSVDEWAKGLTPPPNCMALDDEAHQAMVKAYPPEPGKEGPPPSANKQQEAELEQTTKTARKTKTK